MGAWSLAGFYTILNVSHSTSSFMVSQKSFLTAKRAEALVVIILVTLLWSFCNSLIALIPETPYTGQLYLTKGSNEFLSSFCAVAMDIFFLEKRNNPNPCETFSSVLKFARSSSNVCHQSTCGIIHSLHWRHSHRLQRTIGLLLTIY